jgi:excisionase family DNA binding protein
MRQLNDPLTVAEAAAMLRVSEDTILRAIRRGELVAFRLGPIIRVEPSAVANFVERHTVSPNTDQGLSKKENR